MLRVNNLPCFQRPNGKMYLGTQQDNLVDGVTTVVNLDTIPAAYIDGIENIGTHRITPGIAGFYNIVGQVKFINCVLLRSYDVMLRLNGVDIIVFDYKETISFSYLISRCCLPNHYLLATDFIELCALSNAGNDLCDIANDEWFTFLAVQRVR